MRISVVMPLYNEEKVLPEMVRRLRLVLDKEAPGNYELIFVNDDSSDRSLEILKGFAAERNDVKVINNSKRWGGSQSVLAGFKYSSGDVIIYMDSDLQDPPEVIPKLLRVYEKSDVDVINTTRTARKGESAVKLWVTHLGYKILKMVSSIDVPMETGDFKLLSRRAVNELLKLNERRPFMRGLITWIGFKQAFVPYVRETLRNRLHCGDLARYSWSIRAISWIRL